MPTFLRFDEASVAPLCEELDHWQERLDTKGPLARTWQGRLRSDLQAEAVSASTAMEGVAVTEGEVRRILAGDKPPTIKPEDIRLVEGYRDAMSYVLRRADDPRFLWDVETFVALHDRVLAGDLSRGAGRVRMTQNFVHRDGLVVFTPVPPEDLMEWLIEHTNLMNGGLLHPAAGAAWAHVAMAALHPFKDGNGRVARIAAALAMYQGGYQRPEFTSLEEWWGRHRDDYYAAFACLGSEFDTNADVTPFVDAHLRAQLSQVRALDLRERSERLIWQVLEDGMPSFGLKQRVANACFDAFFGRDVSAGYYRDLADVSRPTATNDLASAVSAGLLTATGERRWRKYLPAERLYSVVATGLGLHLPPDLDASTARALVVTALSERLAEPTS